MLFHGDSIEELKKVADESVDLLCTDPPYGYSFMGKSWDKTLPDIGIFKECLRVLKPGAFAFVMSAPRSDVCARMMLMLEDAGFEIGFTPIYWTYASGFPKAMNIGKAVDKRGVKTTEAAHAFKDEIIRLFDKSNFTLKELNERCGFEASGYLRKSSTWLTVLPSFEKWAVIKKVLQADDSLDARLDILFQEAEREVLASKQKLNTYSNQGYASGVGEYQQTVVDITAPATPEAKALDGSYGNFSPKPAVEVIIVAQKPRNEKTSVDQALAWLNERKEVLRCVAEAVKEQYNQDVIWDEEAQYHPKSA